MVDLWVYSRVSGRCVWSISRPTFAAARAAALREMVHWLRVASGPKDPVWVLRAEARRRYRLSDRPPQRGVRRCPLRPV